MQNKSFCQKLEIHPKLSSNHNPNPRLNPHHISNPNRSKRFFFSKTIVMIYCHFFFVEEMKCVLYFYNILMKAQIICQVVLLEMELVVQN